MTQGQHAQRAGRGLPASDSSASMEAASLAAGSVWAQCGACLGLIWGEGEGLATGEGLQGGRGGGTKRQSKYI